MSDSPEFRRWADNAFKSLMSEDKPKRCKRPKYACLNPDCDYRTAHSRAIITKGKCFRCCTDLIQHSKFNK